MALETKSHFGAKIQDRAKYEDGSRGSWTAKDEPLSEFGEVARTARGAASPSGPSA